MSFLHFGQNIENWIQLHNIHVHYVSSHSEWNPRISEQSSLLLNTLPTWLLSGPYPFISSPELLSHLLESPLISLCTNKYDGSHVCETAFDLVLSMAETLQRLKCKDPRSTMSIIRSHTLFFLNKIAQISFPDAVILGDVPFAISRVPLSHTHALVELEGKEGIATMLVCVLPHDDNSDSVKPHQDIAADVPVIGVLRDAAQPPFNYQIDWDEPMPDSASEFKSSGNSESSGSCHSESGESIKSPSNKSSMSIDNEQDKSHCSKMNHGEQYRGEHEADGDGNDEGDSSTSSLGSQANFHLLYAEKNPAPFIPIISLADSDNILPLIASTLYQRRTLGLCETVVGMVLTPSSTVVRLVWAWLDHNAPYDDALPHVNVCLCAPSNQSHPSLGCYNLADPLSVFHLMGFLFDFRKQNESQTVQPQNGKIVNLQWRGNRFPMSDETKRVAIERWITDVDCVLRPAEKSKQLFVKPSESTNASDVLQRSTPDVVVSDHSGTTIESGAISRKESIGVSSPNSVHGEHSKEDSPSGNVEGSMGAPSNVASKTSKSSISRLSASRFAGLVDDGIQDKLSMSNYLLERHAFTVARIRITPGNSNSDLECQISEEICSKIEEIDALTAPHWPSAWTTLDSMPAVDGAIAERRRELYEDRHILDQANPAFDMEDRVDEYLSRRLSAILWTAEGAAARQTSSIRRGAYEMERRFDWDRLLNLFGMLADDMGASDSLFERRLNLSRNIIQDEAAKTDNMMPALNFLLDTQSTYLQILQRQLGSAKRGTPEYAQAGKAVMREAASSVNVSERLNSYDKQKRLLATRASRESSSGDCDGVITVSGLHFLTDVEKCFEGNRDHATGFVEHFSLLHHPTDEKQSGRESRLQTMKTAVSSTSPQFLELPHETSLSPPPVEAVSDRLFVTDPHSVVKSVQPQSSQHSRPPIQTQLSPSSTSKVDADLLLPILTVEHKRRDETTAEKAANQHRLYSSGSVAFLTAVGIRDMSVFSLITEGPCGVVCCSWHSSVTDQTYLMERNMMSFDISTTVGAFHFATFLVRLRLSHMKNMEVAYERVKSELLHRIRRRDPSLCWTKTHQINEIQGTPTGKTKEKTMQAKKQTKPRSGK